MNKNQQLNQFNRLEYLIGNDNVELLKTKKVLIVGLGGVGGFAVEALARSGIGNITLVDYDTIDITNLNRQIIALHSTIGLKKTTAFKERILNINKDCNITILDLFLDSNNYKEIITDDYDFIIDCCDILEAKKILLLESYNKKIPFIGSMGTANKMDPSKLEIIDIRKTINDPIARIMRKFVKDNKLNQKIMVVSSKELPKKNGTKLGSNAFVPSSAGLLIASFVVRSLINLEK